MFSTDRTLERRPPDLGGSVPHELRPYVCNLNGDVEGVPEVIDLTLEPTVAVDVESLPEPPLQMAPIKSDPEDNEAHSKGTIKGMLSMVAEYIDSSLSLQEFEAHWAELPEITLTAAGPPREGEEEQILLSERQCPYGDAALGGYYLSKMVRLQTLIISEADGMLALKVAIAEHGWGSQLKTLLLDFHTYPCSHIKLHLLQERPRAAVTYCYARDLVPHIPQLRSLEAVKIRAGTLNLLYSEEEMIGSEALEAMRALARAFLQPGAFPNLARNRYDGLPPGDLLWMGEQAGEEDDSKLCLPPSPFGDVPLLQDRLRPEIKELTLNDHTLVRQLASAMVWWRTGLFSTLRVLNFRCDPEVVDGVHSILDCLAAGACPALRELGLFGYADGVLDLRPIVAKLEFGKHLKVECLRLNDIMKDDKELAKALRAGALPHLKTLYITPRHRFSIDVQASWMALRERMDRVPGIRIIVGGMKPFL